MGRRLFEPDVQQLLGIREAQLREAMMIAGMGTWEWDVDRGAVTWSPELRRILGVDADVEATARKFLDLVHPEDLGWAERSMRESLRSGITEDLPFRIVRPDGSIRLVRGRAVTTRYENDRPVYMVGVIQDLGTVSGDGFTRDRDALRRMSERERQVLEMVALGSTSRSIGRALGLSPKTIDTYRSRMMTKLGIEDTAGLVRFCIRNGVTGL